MGIKSKSFDASDLGARVMGRAWSVIFHKLIQQTTNILNVI